MSTLNNCGKKVCFSLFQVVFSVVCLVKSILSWYNINCIEKCTNCLLHKIFSVLCRSRSWYSLDLKCLSENVQAKWWWSDPYLNGMKGEPEKKSLRVEISVHYHPRSQVCNNFTQVCLYLLSVQITDLENPPLLPQIVTQLFWSETNFGEKAAATCGFYWLINVIPVSILTGYA